MGIKKVTLLLFTLLLFASPFVWAQEDQSRIATDYKIGPKDLLEISVFGLDELNKKVRVSEEGKITLPLLGEIDVEGMTNTQLERKLAQLLEEKYLQNPQVSVFIAEYQSKRVSVMGAVQTPGLYDLLGRMTLLQVISLAGGFTENASDKIIIFRDTRDGQTSIEIPIDDLILKGDPQYNIPLEPNDIVNIPAERMVYIYVFGQVKSPGALLVKKSRIPTLLQAIAQAGGFTERAQKGNILIKRIGKDGKEEQMKVNAKQIMGGKKKDFQLLENDTVFVPETIF